MNTAEGFPSTPEPAPEDGEPPSPGTKRSWESEWTIDPFATDVEYINGLENLKLLEGRTDADKQRDEAALVVASIRRYENERRFLSPAHEPKPMTGPQRIGVAIMKFFKTESRSV